MSDQDNPSKLSRSLCIAGVKHSGKSTFGHLLSKLLDVLFFDSDELLLLEYNERHPSPFSSFRDLYREKGKDVFQEFEALGLKNYFDNETVHGIISLGGGVIDNDQAMETVKKHSHIIYLDVPFEILYDRVIGHGVPPFLDKEDPMGSFLKLYKHRSDAYRKVADIKVELGAKSIDEGIQILYNVILEAQHVWQ